MKVSHNRDSENLFSKHCDFIAAHERVAGGRQTVGRHRPITDSWSRGDIFIPCGLTTFNHFQRHSTSFVSLTLQPKNTFKMSERKVLTKYYPPDFDPSAIGRTPKHLRQKGPKVITVRLMAPFSMKCTHCGEYIYRGRKFNARKENLEEKYLSIPIYRFYIRCTRCSGEITFRTDPKSKTRPFLYPQLHFTS